MIVKLAPKTFGGRVFIAWRKMEVIEIFEPAISEDKTNKLSL